MWNKKTPWDGAAFPPRRCQQEGLAALMAAPWGGVATMATGSGKALLIAELCRLWDGDVLVTAPTVALVDQLGDDIEARCWGEVGRVYTHGARVGRVTVACMPSMHRAVGMLPDPARTLWIADEAHRTSTGQASDALPMRLGLSATPYGSEVGQGLTRFDFEVYRYTVSDAVRDGVLVPWRVGVWPGGGVDSGCADWIAVQRGAGVVSADSIADALAFAELLEDRGVRSAVVHSRMARGAVMAARDSLYAGRIACIVHVRMLVEGVDMPWLQWGCLRARRSRVGLVQEVGRFLRSSPNKSFASLLDPHGLLDEFGLVHPADLGTDARAAKEAAEREAMEYDLELRQQAARDAMDAVSIAAPEEIELWAAGVRQALAGAGVVVEGEWARYRGWRSEPATERQMDAVRKWRHAAERLALGGPAQQRVHALWLYVQAQRAPRRGLAADVLTVLPAFVRTPGDTRRALASWGLL